MNKPLVRVRIERLLLDGVDPSAGRQLAAALETQLARLIAGQPVGGVTPGHTDRISLDLAGSTATGMPDRLARTVATVIHERLSHGP